MAYLGDINTSAHFGQQLSGFVFGANDAIQRAKQLKLYSDQITSNGTTNFAALETEFGIPTGHGQDFVNALNAYIAAVEPGGVRMALLTAIG